MTTSGPAKVFIKVESSAEQQENLKNIRKQFKPIQAVATDKENLTGRTTIIGKGGKTKLDTETIKEKSDITKRKKCDTKSTQTDASVEAISNDTELSKKKQITVEDLTTADKPGEYYWELLAEKRRLALEDTLEENKKLYERIEALEAELEISRKMVDEANGLVEVLTEMLQENENEKDDHNDHEPVAGTSSSSLNKVEEVEDGEDSFNKLNSTATDSDSD